MSKIVQALVKPELLVWARRNSGYDIETVARKVRVKPERMEMWELGEARPTINQLRNLARVYKRPIAVFYLPEPPRGFQAMNDFRTLPSQEQQAKSPELRLAIRQVRERREIAYELAENIAHRISPVPISADIRRDPERLGHEIRALLGVSLEDQYKWTSGRLSFNNWRSAFESSGILVFQIYDVAVNEVRGFSLSADPIPVIAVNVKDSYNGRIFTLFHELAHITIRDTGVCDLAELRFRSDEARVEEFCNQVAGAALAPIAAIRAQHPEGTRSAHADWPDEEIDTLSRQFGVSREALVRRLVFAGLAGEEFYRLKREQYQAEYEKLSSSPKKSGRGPLPHIKTLSSLGNTFVNLVLQNFYTDNITASAVADYLDMKLGHLGKLESSLAPNRNV